MIFIIYKYMSLYMYRVLLCSGLMNFYRNLLKDNLKYVYLYLDIYSGSFNIYIYTELYSYIYEYICT